MELSTIITGLFVFALFFFYVSTKRYLVRDYYQDMVTTSWPGGVAVPQPPASGSY
jgi:hypothetical protein